MGESIATLYDSIVKKSPENKAVRATLTFIHQMVRTRYSFIPISFDQFLNFCSQSFYFFVCSIHSTAKDHVTE